MTRPREIIVRGHQPRAAAVDADVRQRQAQGIAICHGAHVHAAATGELDEDPDTGIDFEDLEDSVACVELEFSAENAPIPDCRQKRAQCLYRRLDLSQWHADHTRAVAEIWW